MPFLDGGQVLRSVMLLPQLCNLVILMISVDDDHRYAQTLVEAGAKEHLLKPINQSTIAQIVPKLNMWQSQCQGPSLLQLRTLYSTSENLSMHVRCITPRTHALYALDDVDATLETLRIRNGSADRASFTDGVAAGCSAQQILTGDAAPAGGGEEEALSVHFLAASHGLRQLLKVDHVPLHSDALGLVKEEDREAIRLHLLTTTEDRHRGVDERADERGGELPRRRQLMWRLVATDGSVVPVVGCWIHVGDGTVLMECTSLLPILMQQEAEGARDEAEVKVAIAERCNSDLVKQHKAQARQHMLAQGELSELFVNFGPPANSPTTGPLSLALQHREQALRSRNSNSRCRLEGTQRQCCLRNVRTYCNEIK